MGGVTDALLGMAETARRGDAPGALAQLDALRQRHEAAIQALAPEDGALAAHADETFRDLAAIVSALVVLREVSPQTVDVVAGQWRTAQLAASGCRNVGGRPAR